MSLTAPVVPAFGERLARAWAAVPWPALSLAVCAAWVLVLAAMALARPGYSYDLVAYLGAMHWANGADPFEAWRTARSAIPAPDFEPLATGDAYRQVQSSNPAAFGSITPLYAVKIGYVWLLQALTALGEPVRGATVLSTLGATAVAAASARWLVAAGRGPALPVALAALFAMDWFGLARHASPDAIAAGFIAWALYLWWRGSVAWCAALLWAAFLFRPDTIVCAAALFVAGSVLRLGWKTMAVTTVAMLVASILIKGWAGHPGWWVHFHFSTVALQPTLSGFAPPVSVQDLGVGYARGAWMSLTDFAWPSVVLATAALGIWLQRISPLPPRTIALVAAMAMTIAGKFVLFPLPDDRLYLPFVLTALLALLARWPAPQSFLGGSGAAMGKPTGT